MKDYDLIVVGGGHAGVEASWAATKFKKKVLLITMNVDTIAQLSCNPSIGGLAKSHLVKEIDILGGLMGRAADATGIQFKTLNISKGPAVWALRTQNDKMAYSFYMRKKLEENPYIDIVQDEVVDMDFSNDRFNSITARLNGIIKGKKLILTSGTFLNGLIHIGKNKIKSGRLGEGAASHLTEKFNNLGFETIRLKTGTPPRISGSSINFEGLDIHGSDKEIVNFSFKSDGSRIKQLPCYITATNETTHQIIEDNFHNTALFSGQIEGTGPRYCPSIEDKVNRFSGKNSHRIFLEPEGLYTNEYYINGFSTSLPMEIQKKAIRTIKGLENAHFVRPAYAIEYDYFPSYQIKTSLETKKVEGLYFAGQINGTSGYEEAASQGLVAGVNASLSIDGRDPMIFKRSEAYIGVLIDDLITKDIREPYRMFTALAEHRLELRHDNADFRLLKYAKKYHLHNDEDIEFLENRISRIEELKEYYKGITIKKDQVNSILEKKNLPKVNEGSKLVKLLKRPQIEIDDIYSLGVIDLEKYSKYECKQAEILTKYEGYIARQREIIERSEKNESLKMPSNFDYKKFSGLKNEAIEKLNRIQPDSVGQAGRIAGISPADVSIILINLKKGGYIK
ncbi:MAG: tRNA uridine-5-carboxymethylaminomethyl(34) synthesis enzyme MnmG [Candidatus Cloacimonadota bacterium]|nr:MAG: tRNA uridine-5-carboxymethylaminomethyl(34) synthesis enzyme MnmG [Candidatus Cloacimonadota bacterium]PIE79200.1 MAG: tRNA uridine-5-carboxymethylaminomethyl(34) synthesis enzyme MnmG [Candidatus Delongbacteria bacterium]